MGLVIPASLRHATLPKGLPPPSKSVNPGFPITSMATGMHLVMQTASKDISEGMSRSQELSEFQCGTVIGCHLYSREISSLLNISQSTLSGIISK